MPQPNWVTSAGSLGGFPFGVPISLSLVAVPVLPATSVTYSLLGGTLPTGIEFSSLGILSGTPIISETTTFEFAIRATDNLGNIKDRTFLMTISGVSAPRFTETSGELLRRWDSVWIEKQVSYANPIPDNPITIRLIQGRLPPGLEINQNGMIRGYAEPPVVTVNYVATESTGSATSASTNEITCFSTVDFSVNRPVIFTGTTYGNIEPSKIYYIKSITGGFTFTISETREGPEFPLLNGTGIFNIILPSVSIGQPAVITYAFTLKLESPYDLVGDQQLFQITIENQNASISQGGPQNQERFPVIQNTRPPTFLVEKSPNYGYYILPPTERETGITYPITVFAPIGEFKSDNFFAFKVLGVDFDNDEIEYIYENLPSFLTGDPDTGWITGTTFIAPDTISTFSFNVRVRKKLLINYESDPINFSFALTSNLNSEILWITPPNLGVVYNNTFSNLSVKAQSELSLQYRLAPNSGPLPPNLTLLSNGEITGKIAFQPTSQLLSLGETTTFTFEVEAYSALTSLVSSRTFTLIVEQAFDKVTENLYIKAFPTLEDRILLDTLLLNEEIFPNEAIYRPDDSNYGKAKNVSFGHAYGINSSSFDQYVAAVVENHYWKNVTLGPISTAVAKNDRGEIIYEVVYSKIIDDLINPEGISIPKQIAWPFDIDLHLGPWYTSSTTILTSWIWNLPGNMKIITENYLEIETENGQEILTETGSPQYYTSLTSGFARVLYPNSLPDMVQRVQEELGAVNDPRLLPRWMTSQQKNGSTLGFIPAWVICYTKPGYSELIKNNIETKWPYKLNTIDFEIDRFAVDRNTTYNFENTIYNDYTEEFGVWTTLPSAEPTPDPPDVKNFYVLFPRKTILPNKTQ